jgi:hypothetical protein
LITKVEVKDGKGIAIYHMRIDESKPYCYREGNEYKFNTEYLSVEHKNNEYCGLEK